MAEVGHPSAYDPSYCERILELGKRVMNRIEGAANIILALQFWAR